jgi:hypothetical protein
MSKKKAKRSPAKKIPRDRRGQQFLFHPKTGEPTEVRRAEPKSPNPPPTPEESAARRARAVAREAEAEARRTAFRSRLARRPVEMRRANYRLPSDVEEFLGRLGWDGFDEMMHVKEIKHAAGLGDWEIRDAIEAVMTFAYMEGCRQGFIEGFLYGEDKARPGALKNRERLRQQNLDKLARLGIADRNAEIVAAFGHLERELPGKEQRYEKLAADYELTVRQIGTIVRRVSKRRR